MLTGEIIGTVTLYDSIGNQIKRADLQRGVTVEVLGKGITAQTDESAKYILRNVPQGIYTLKYSKAGFADNYMTNVMVTGDGRSILSAKRLLQPTDYAVTSLSVLPDTLLDRIQFTGSVIGRPALSLDTGSIIVLFGNSSSVSKENYLFCVTDIAFVKNSFNLFQGYVSYNDLSAFFGAGSTVYAVGYSKNPQDVDGWTDPQSLVYHYSSLSGTSSSIASLTLPSNFGNAPAAPSELTSTLAHYRVELRWKDNSTNESDFIIERKVKDSVFIPIQSFTAVKGAGGYVNAYDYWVEGNSRYTYRIKARNSFGSSVSSNEDMVATPIAAPTDLKVTMNSHAGVSISWKDNATNEEYYWLERRVGSGNYQTVSQYIYGATGTGNMISYQDTKVFSSTTYSYRVRASYGGYIQSEYSNEVTVTTGIVAHISEYQFASSQGIYTPLDSSTILIPGNVNGIMSSYREIGFAFNFGLIGSPYFQLTDDGTIYLGGSYYRIKPFFTDLATAENGSVGFFVSGTSPHRVMTIEYRNMRWANIVSNDRMNFQVRLHELTGMIEFMYGAGPSSILQNASIGLSDQEFNKHLHVKTDGTTTTSNTFPVITSWPGNGKVYTFTRPK